MREMGETPRKMRKGLWSPDEDEKLSRCIAMYMNGSWSDIARKAGLERCGKSCRRRWMNHLRPDLKRGRFTPAEINRVVELHKALGNRWSEIAGHLVGRTDNDVKNLWNTQIKRRLKLQASLESSVIGDDTLTKVESQGDEAVSCQDDGGRHTCVTSHKMGRGGVEKMVYALDTPSSSSSLQGLSPDQYEDTLSCYLPSSSNGPLDHVEASLSPQTTSVSDPVSTQPMKPASKPASVFTFPFSSGPADLHDETVNGLLVIDASDASELFTSLPLMDRPKANPHIYVGSPGAAFQKCTSTQKHIPPALSSSNLRGPEASTTDEKTATAYVDLPPSVKELAENAMDIDVNDCHVERLDTQKCRHAALLDQGVDPQHRGSSSYPAENCDINVTRELCAFLETALPVTYCSLPNLYEGARCSSTTESSTSTCSSSNTDQSRTIFSDSHFGSSYKFKAAALVNASELEGYVCKEKWQLMYNDAGEVQVHGSEYQKELLSDISRSALLSKSGSSDDYICSWWNSLEVPSFELPNIDEANCWAQPLDVDFV